MTRLPALQAGLALLVACSADLPPAPAMPESPELVPPPAAIGAGEPFLAAAADGAVILSWLEPTSDSTHALRHARFLGDGWTPARTIAEGADWFVNWADFPSVVELPDRSLAAHWLRRSGPGSYAYDVWTARSADGGASWSGPVRPHTDGTATEHGFVTLFPHQGTLGIVWLDGRQYAGEGAHGGQTAGQMALRYGLLDHAAVQGETVLDERTCDCCQTAVALAEDGPVVFYRDRSADEIRDIAVTRLVQGRWTAPAPVHRDGWRIDACPVNGPAAAAAGNDVAVAWFTAAGDTPRVLVAFSADAGAHFDAPVRIDAGDPVGRVALANGGPGAVWVSWLEHVGAGAELRVRRISSASERGQMLRLASVSGARATGFPRLLRHAGALWAAWTEPGDSGGVRVARARLHEPGTRP